MSYFSPFASSINRAFEVNQWPIHITGTTSPLFVAHFLSSRIGPFTQPTLVVLPTEKSAKSFIDDLRALTPLLNPILLTHFDEDPYSGLYPSVDSVSKRCTFLWHAIAAKPHEIFVSSIEALLQKTAPKDIFSTFITNLGVGDEVSQKNIIETLVNCGYESAPLVEDIGTYSLRGDILDIFSPNYADPLRLEFFGDQIESIRFFNITSQTSTSDLKEVCLIPCREILLNNNNASTAMQRIKDFCDENGIKKDVRESLIEPIKQGIFPHSLDFWFYCFYKETSSVLSYFKIPPHVFFIDELEITRVADQLLVTHKTAYKKLLASNHAVPDFNEIFDSLDKAKQSVSHPLFFNDISLNSEQGIHTSVFDTSDFVTVVRASKESKKDFIKTSVDKLQQWVSDGHFCFIFSGTQTQTQRLEYLFGTHGLVAHVLKNDDPINTPSSPGVYLVSRFLSTSKRFETEHVVFLRDEEFFGSKVHKETRRTKGTLEQRTNTLSFGDLNPNDFIVHTLHGIGIYEGLKKMPVHGAETEFIQLRYKDNDRLYLPIYRIAQIQKYSSPAGYAAIDKLGTTSWQKAKVKVRSDLKEIASELLALYAKRQAAPGFSFSPPDDQFRQFEASFPYDETDDQLKAINDVLQDMRTPRPMDRLVCGDVGFGKTEVAIRAAYKAVLDKKQVALLVPTTILAFQHFQTFSKRFSGEAVSVAMLSRFSSTQEAKKIITLLEQGKIDIVIGTHRLLSKDISFKDLGLLIVDEEQKFGVTHKEKIKKLRSSVDVLSLSATPIPRTLNMALMGIRDLSIINTPPEDRLSIRTFINRYNGDTIKKAIQNEINRGGQVYFIHNRVQSIYEFCSKIRELVPNARITVAHGQMPDEDLEKTMLAFYNHEFDVLVCTTIIESGLDIPRANTIIIDRADTFGLSQLYQLRGRVGRSKERAYAYLLIPETGAIDKVAAERLKVLHEHTELGAGFQIAHHDLELRGSGNILGDDQSGHISAVGYELYMELLDNALKMAKGETVKEEIEPEINLRIPAFIPDTYIEDIRIRLGYYKLLTEINDESDLDQIEKEMVDRFGQIPEQVANLFGTMLIRKMCKDLGVRDISSGPKNISLTFTNQTPVKPESIVRLTQNENKKYTITPEQKLIIRFSSEKWAPIYEELKFLKFCL